MKRAIIIVLDGVGVGAMPDAADYGDEGSNTLGGILKAYPDLPLPNLDSLGLLNLVPGPEKNKQVIGAYGKMALGSPNKDTISGHWELAGIVLDKPFLTFPAGFPAELMAKFKEATGYGYLGNKKASGTEIIEELIEEHIKTKDPIVYTSADSVFQVAAHEEIIPLPALYEICRKARKLLVGSWMVARVIARPFKGKPGSLYRTAGRKDYSIPPPAETMLEKLSRAGYQTCTIGKIDNIFNGLGIDMTIPTVGNREGMAKIISCLKEGRAQFMMANLVDFDMLYGHRNDVEGFGRALVEFDGFIPELLATMSEEDLLIITADHGCDPTFAGTDHTREYVPLLVWGKRIKPNVCLGRRDTLADVGATMADYFGIEGTGTGQSFYSELF